MDTPTIVDPKATSPYFTSRKVNIARIGRPKGANNKVGADAKWCIQEVFRLRGGVTGMKAWADAFPSEFYQAYIRALVPRATEATKGEGIRVVIYNHAEHGSDKGAEVLKVELDQAEDVSTSQADM